MKQLLLAPLLALLAFGPAMAQTPIQQTASRLDAGQFVAMGTNFSAVGTTAVATATSGGGLYIYITNIVIDFCGDGVANGAVMTNALVTSSGIAGAPSWQWSQPVTANESCTHLGDGPFATPLKSASPGTNVVITSPAMPTHTAAAIKIYYYLAP